MAKFANILETVGNTPVVRVGKLAPAGIDLYVKVEAFNPLGSVKDRLALGIIDDGERRGELKPGQTVVEATSGNTGIALALVCAARGYPFVAIMPDSFSVERRQIMRAYGAKVVLRTAAGSSRGSSTTSRIPRSTARPPARRSSPISRAAGSTTGSRAGAPAERS